MSSDWRLVTAPGKTIANILLNCSGRSDTSSSSSLPASTCATRRTRTSGAGLDDGEEEGEGVPIVAGEDGPASPECRDIEPLGARPAPRPTVR